MKILLAIAMLLAAPAMAQPVPNRTHELTPMEYKAITDYVRQCWSIDPGMPDLEQMSLAITVYVSSRGILERWVAPNVDSLPIRTRVFAERARRALYECHRVPLPLQRMKWDWLPMLLTIQFHP